MCLVLIFFLYLFLGPKYLLKLQQEFKALRVLLTMESDGDMDHAGGEGNNSIKRFLTDIKEEEAISTSSNWCRELDCLRAYYYLAVLDFLHETQRAGEVAGSPGGGSVSGGSAQENDSLDGEPTSEGSSSGAPSAGRSVTLSPGSNVEDKKAQSEDSEDVGPSPSQDCDQKGKLSGKEGVETPGADKSKSVPAANFVCDQDCDDSSKKPEKGNANLKSPSKSSESKSSIAGVSATVPQLDATSSLSSLDSSVDPPPLPVSPGAAHTKDHQKLASPGTGPHPPPAASLSPTGQKSPKKSTEAFSTKSTSPHHVSLSPHNQSSHQMSPSHHITSIASSPQTPASRSSTASTPAKDRRAELNKEKLLRLSRGLLWDSQAKSECLTETLGYIHKAISQHLLANRAPTTPPTSGSPMAAPASASTAASPGGEQLSSDAASSTSPAKSPGSAHQAGGKSNSPQAQSSCVESSAKTSPAPLSASTPPGVVHNPGDSLEEDGSVQQRRMTNLSNSPQQQGAGNSSPGTSTKDTSPSQATLLQQQSPSDPKTSPPSSSKPSQLPRSVSAGTSPVSQSSVLTAATVTQSPRAAARSLSESSSGSAAVGFDRSIGIQAERDLLGELAGEPISFSNSKKVCSGKVHKISHPSSFTH